MSNYLHNLVLRAAGLAPVMQPAAFPIPPVEETGPALEELKQEEPADTSSGPVATDLKSPVQAMPVPSEKPQGARPAQITEVAHTERTQQAPAALQSAAVRRADPPAPRLKTPAVPVRERIDPSATVLPPILEPAPSPEMMPLQPHVETLPRSQEAPPATPLAAAPKRPTARSRETEARRVRQIELVDRPALPPIVIEQVTAVVEKRIPEGPAHIDVHINKVEVVVPRPPLPAPKPPPRQPRGFGDHALDRRHLSRRWY